MNKIKILDCTLRDGGFVNDWNFGHNAIYNIYTRLVNANIDILELGFLNEKYPFDINCSIMPHSKYLPKVFNMETENKPMLVAMIIMGECSIDNVGKQSESLVEGIRIVFKKSQMDEGLEFAKKVKEKGYKIFLQPASVTDYSEEDIKELAQKANKLDPVAVYIVDTYGLLHKGKLFEYFNTMDKYLCPDVSIGFHSHNNLQMSYSSAIDILDIETNREVIIDSTLFGIGKGCGNLNTELIADYLNKYHGKTYDMLQILETIDLEILKIKQICDWGYSFSGFLAASNQCHPKYVKYLVDKKTLSVKSINQILCKLDGLKTEFKKPLIEKLYFEFQSNEIDDTETYNQLRSTMDRSILLLAPGSSLNKESENINAFIKQENPIIIAINHNPYCYKADYYFINNAKRYSQMAEYLEQNPDAKIIATSNVTPVNTKFEFYLNYSNMLVPGDINIISDNATLMLINAFIKMGFKGINIAGFDGFSANLNENYVESYLSYNMNSNINEQNVLISSAVKAMKQLIDINFITKTHYC